MTFIVNAQRDLKQGVAQWLANHSKRHSELTEEPLGVAWRCFARLSVTTRCTYQPWDLEPLLPIWAWP